MAVSTCVTQSLGCQPRICGRPTNPSNIATAPPVMAHLRLLLVCLYFDQVAGVLWKPHWKVAKSTQEGRPRGGDVRGALPDAIRYTANGNPWPSPAASTPLGEGGSSASTPLGEGGSAWSASSARWSGQEAVRGDGHRRYYDKGWQEKDSGWYGAGLIVFASHVRSSSWHGLSVVRSSFWYGLSLARSLRPSPFPRARPLLCLSGRGGFLRWPAILMQRSN